MSDTETAYAWFDGAVRQTVTARPDSSTTWQTQHTLDARGRVTQASISDGRPRTVAFVYNDENEILNRVETGSGSPWTTRSHYVAGKVIDADPLTASTDTDSADGQIVVREGDTLQTLAASNWGDATLWYLIAERNGLSGSETLEAGQVIWLPANVNRSRNAADTFTPYDPNKAMGRLDPTQPKPTERPGGCGVVGQIMTAVVAIAVTVIAGPVLGNLAGQAFGLATGNQDQFSWKSLGLSVLASGVNAVMKTVVETGLKLTGTAAAIVSATASNVVTQGIGVATGLQDRFDWTGVAASALMAGVGSEVGQAADRYMSADAAQFASSTASAFAGAATRTLLDGTSFGDNIIAVLPDVIGQTVGNRVAGGMAARAAELRTLPAEDAAREALAFTEGYFGLPTMMLGMGAGVGIAAGGRASAWDRLKQGVGDFLRNPIGSTIRGGRALIGSVSQAIDYRREPVGATNASLSDDVIELSEVVVNGIRHPAATANNVIISGLMTFVAPIGRKIEDAGQAISDGFRHLYLNNPSSGQPMPTGYADAMGNYYPGTGDLPGNNYNPLAHPKTTAVMAGGVIAAPYAAIAVGPYVLPAAVAIGAAQMGLDDGPVPIIPGSLGRAEEAIELTARAANASRTMASSAAETATARAARLGMEGEQAVGLFGPKVGIRIPGANNLRFPDNLSATTLTEVKNVGRQGFTGQLKDYVTFSKANDLDFELFVRGPLHPQGPTTFTKPLADAVRRGDITPRYIPGTH